MHRHLIPVKISVKRRRHHRVNLHRFAFNQNRLERLNAQPVQRRRPVQQHVVHTRYLFQRVPHFGNALLDQPRRRANVVRQLPRDQLMNDKRLKQFQRHQLGQAALVQLELRPHHNHRAARVVHPLAQQVLAETALLPFEHIGQRFKLAPRARHAGGRRAAARRVVSQCIHRFLQHPPLIARNHLRRPQLQQPLQTVVAVDHPPVQIIEITRCVPPAIKLYHRPQIGRNDRQHCQQHPLRTDAGLEQRADQ